MKSKPLLFLSILLSLVVAFAPAMPTNAAISIVPADCQDEDGCNICELVKMFTNGATIIGGALGVNALLLFLIGGFMLIFSGGNPDRVQRGKKLLVGTITGIAIVFLAWFAVNTLVRIAAVSGAKAPGIQGSAKIFSEEWWDFSYCQAKTSTSCVGLYVGELCGFGECTTSGSACSCFRPLKAEGDDKLCSEDVAGADAASSEGKKCACTSSCTILKEQTNKEYACITEKQSESGYTVASGYSCPQEGYVCALKNE